MILRGMYAIQPNSAKQTVNNNKIIYFFTEFLCNIYFN